MNADNAPNSFILRSALLVASSVCLLTLGVVFGVMLGGLGGQVLYPIVDETGVYRTNATGQILPHPDVGTAANQFDQILVVVLNRWRTTSLRPGQPGMPQRLLHRASLVRRKLEERPQKGSDLARVGRRHVVLLSEAALQVPTSELVDVF